MDIDMRRLTTCGFERGICAVKAECRIRAEHAFDDLSCEGVCNHVGEYVPVFEDGFLLDVSR